MDASAGTTPVAIGEGVSQFASLNSNIDPADTTLGLKSNHDFVVEGRFDLVLPDIGERYGVRLSDNVSPATRATMSSRSSSPARRTAACAYAWSRRISSPASGTPSRPCCSIRRPATTRSCCA